MNSYNKCTLEGFITHDLEPLHTTKSGKSVTEFTIAINHHSRSGDEYPRVSFIAVELWEKLAETYHPMLSKGKRIRVSGVLRQDRWEDDDGKMKSKLKVIANEVNVISAGGQVK